MTITQKKYLTQEELEKEYDISISTQGKYRMAKKIPFIKIGGRYIRYNREQIEAWLDSHSVPMKVVA